VTGPEVVEELAWMVRANCRGVDAELFFPGRGESTYPAKQVCAGCVVRAECFDYAMANAERYGVWAGLSERERHRMRRGAA
jgi:WhiB family redox-sensing transcriptional regulator